jgi:hypothetical protein
MGANAFLGLSESPLFDKGVAKSIVTATLVYNG